MNRLQISLLRRFILCNAVKQGLGVGADGGQGAFQVVGHPGDQLLLFLLRELLLLQRGFQPRRHLVHRVAGGFEFVRLAIGDGRAQIAVTDTGNARRQSIQRLGNVAEDVARQIEIGQGDGEQQRCNYRTRVYAGESLKTRKQRFDLFAGLVQLPQGKSHLRKIHRLQKKQRRRKTDDKQDARRQHRNHQHHQIGARQPLFDGHRQYLRFVLRPLYHNSPS